MFYVQKALTEVQGPPVEAGSARFEINREGRDVWNCFAVLVFYCYDILEKKATSSVKHATAVKIPCQDAC